MTGYEDYSELSGTGYQGGGKPEIAPEDEFFHSVYISTNSRKNHINITEEAGKLQVRGVQYNLDEVHMIITHVKEILAKIKNVKGVGDRTECFSYKDGQYPWHGTTRLANGELRQCPQTSAERALNDFCNPCRTQILVAGIYCKADGSPILTEERKPIFVFLRGRGTRYPNISSYLSDLYSDDTIEPFFEPVTEQSKMFEKEIVNNKRFVTKITRGQTTTQYSTVNVFELDRGTKLPLDAVKQILKLSKETVSKFNDKFDWSKTKAAVGYDNKPEGVLSVDEEPKKESETETGKESKVDQSENGKSFSFEDIDW